ncbi:MAG: glycosyltransferase family 1 protein [Chloroflexota bacterium]|nr:glycosyltransferase family 4 protein [Dehalococcoidia bacterium]MDW8253207.1 glycosyltransferase family 1 protein [Chloroflexota bacterium]
MKVGLSGEFINRPWTGTGQYSVRLAEWLARSGVLLTVLGRGSSGALAKLAWEYVGVLRAARAAGVQLLHVPYLGPPLRSPFPLVVTVHDLIMLALPEHRGPLPYRVYTHLALAGARRADLILADSETTRRDLERFGGIPASRVEVVPLGHDERLAAPASPRELAAYRSAARLPERFVLYLGGFDARKNVPLLLRAAARAGEWPLVIAGEPPPPRPPLYPDVRAEAAPLGDRLRWLGRVAEEEKRLLYQAATVFCYPSRYEGFGLPVLEAMAAGTPVICADATSVAEVAGDACELVPPDDEEALASALARLMADEQRRAELRARGRERARLFTWERTARATARAYSRVLDR